MKNKRLSWSFLAVSLLLVACRQDIERQQPANLIPEEKVIEMMTEQLILESVIFEMPQDTNKQVVAEKAYAAWFQKYKVTPQQFEQSVDYYCSDDQDAERIMTKVQQNVDKRRAAIK